VRLGQELADHHAEHAGRTCACVAHGVEVRAEHEAGQPGPVAFIAAQTTLADSRHAQALIRRLAASAEDQPSLRRTLLGRQEYARQPP